MKLARYILSIVFLSIFILFAIANNDLVLINFPNIPGVTSGKSIYLPIYLFASLAILVGLAIGVLIEYLRNFRIRKTFNENKKKLFNTEKELQKSKEKFLTEDEKIFNMLD